MAAHTCTGSHSALKYSLPSFSVVSLFPCCPQVWLQAVALELGEGGGGSGAAQKLLDRALNTLPSRKHIKVALCNQDAGI